jgi:hypothetical protein
LSSSSVWMPNNAFHGRRARFAGPRRERGRWASWERHMKRLLTAAAALTVAGCADPGSFSQELKVAYGQQVAISGEALTIAFTEVNEDSRCPSGVQCGSAGQATITLVLSKGDSQSRTVTTYPGPETTTYMNYTVTLLELAPNPPSLPYPAPEEYEATLVIERP